MSCELNWQQHGVFRSLFGDVRVEELTESLARIGADDRLAMCRYVLSDWLGMRRFAYDPIALRAMHEAEHALYRRSGGSIYFVMVAAGETRLKLEQGFSAAGCTLHPVNYFDSVGHARAWLSEWIPQIRTTW